MPGEREMFDRTFPVVLYDTSRLWVKKVSENKIREILDYEIRK
jgi:hypothetical protein